MAHVVIAGGGICGLAAAMMLADDGHDVTVFERDDAPPPPGPAEAADWDRQSIAQFGLGHWMHPRGTAILRNSVPRAYELIRDNGGLSFNLVKYLLGVQGLEPEPADDRFDLLTGRRSTLEWALATATDEHPGVDVQRGRPIAGFIADTEGPIPHVTGLRMADGDDAVADLVVDATGRRSSTPAWLAQIGARPPHEVTEDSGFAYYGRYFRSHDGSTPAIFGPLLTPFGSFSLLTLPADNGTWSVTLYGLADDKPARRFREPDVFERVVAELPLHAHWLDGEAITEMASMVGPVDRERSYVVDGVPCATGVLTVADAHSCTNPSLGRGMSLGLMHVEILRESVKAHLDDPTALAIAFHERTKAELQPYHDATTRVDRRRVDEMRIYRDGGTPQPTPEERLTDVLIGNAAADPVMARSYGDIMGCNALAEEVLARPGVFDRLLELGDGPAPQPAPGPSRERLVELVA
jgi:2-polyprenyl-6-methoxyphenol hydroxylase-like FAD-dependent oxidoreductase